jgi:CheY-like chemotaxis protein
MPFKNGIEVVKELKQYFLDNCEKLEPPVYVFLTAFAAPAFKAYTA